MRKDAAATIAITAKNDSTDECPAFRQRDLTDGTTVIALLP